MLEVPEGKRDTIDSVDYQGYYEGYDENGDGRTRDWHGFTKKRRPVAILGTATLPPFAATWDLAMLPAQDSMAVRASFASRVGQSLPTSRTRREACEFRNALESGWSWSLLVTCRCRSGRGRIGRSACTIALDADPARIERAELHVVVWDGGAGTVKDYFTFNGRPVPVAATGKHDVIYSRRELDPRLFERGTNRIELRSDTEHHGIEVLMPGPAIMVRRTSGP